MKRMRCQSETDNSDTHDIKSRDHNMHYTTQDRHHNQLRIRGSGSYISYENTKPEIRM